MSSAMQNKSSKSTIVPGGLPTKRDTSRIVSVDDPCGSTEVMLEGAVASPRRDDLPKVSAYPY